MVKTKKVLREELAKKLFKYQELRVVINNATQYQETIDRDIRKLLSQLEVSSFQNKYVRGWINTDDVLEVF